MEGMVQIPFTYTDGTLNYSDALYLPEGHSFTEEQIEAMKKERFDNWKEFITNPPPAPTNEELEAMGVVIPQEPTEQPTTNEQLEAMGVVIPQEPTEEPTPTE